MVPGSAQRAALSVVAEAIAAVADTTQSTHTRSISTGPLDSRPGRCHLGHRALTALRRDRVVTARCSCLLSRGVDGAAAVPAQIFTACLCPTGRHGSLLCRRSSPRTSTPWRR